jgi:hypothetical protein
MSFDEAMARVLRVKPEPEKRATTAKKASPRKARSRPARQKK